jgi:hypothetical protein
VAPAFPFVHLTNSVLFSQLAAARDKLYLKFNYSDVHEAFANVPSQILGLFCLRYLALTRIVQDLLCLLWGQKKKKGNAKMPGQCWWPTHRYRSSCGNRSREKEHGQRASF